MLELRTHKKIETSDTFDHTFCISERLGIPAEEIVILDIETTGFNRHKDIISVVGIIKFSSNSQCEIIQLFNDDGHSDALIITELMQLLDRMSLIITYNGDGFDIPFLNYKAKMHGITGIDCRGNNSLLHSLDLLKISRELFRHLPRKNLKSVEAALGIERLDSIDGKEAADSYKRYLKYGSVDDRDRILLHNYEDILNLIPLFSSLHERALQSDPLIFPYHMRIGDNLILIHSSKIDLNLITIIGKKSVITGKSIGSIQPESDTLWLYNEEYSEKIKSIDFLKNKDHVTVKCSVVYASPYVFFNPFIDMNELLSLPEEHLYSLIIKDDGQWRFKTIQSISALLVHRLSD